MVLARCSPLSGTALLLPVLKKLWVAKNSHTAALIHQSKCGAAVQPLFVFMSSRQNYRYWQVNDTPCRTQENMKHTAWITQQAIYPPSTSGDALQIIQDLWVSDSAWHRKSGERTTTPPQTGLKKKKKKNSKKLRASTPCSNVLPTLPTTIHETVFGKKKSGIKSQT